MLNFRTLALAFSFVLPSFVDSSFAKESPTTKPSASKATVDVSDADALNSSEGLPTTVVGTVKKASWSSSGKVMRISFKGAEKSNFEAVVFEKNKDALDKKFGGDAAEKLSGTKVKLKGKVSMFAPKNSPDDKHPQIVVNDVKQIELAEEAK